MKVIVERDSWDDYRENVWGGATDVVEEVEVQDKENEAIEIIEEYMSEDTLGHIPSETEVNDFIWFGLADIMNLYDEDEEDDDENDDDDEDDEEYEEDEE